MVVYPAAGRLHVAESPSVGEDAKIEEEISLCRLLITGNRRRG